MDDLYDSVIHFTMESALCKYLAKERNKALRRELEAWEIDKNLLQEECLWLKARIMKVENTMKETLESLDKLQADLDEANTSKLALRIGSKALRIKWLSFSGKSRSCSLKLKRVGPPKTRLLS